jgi:type IV pilus assembly protein PilX
MTLRTVAPQRGIALITSLLLLMIITILALGMFRSFGAQEKIAGNVRDKERALHAAESAQQYAEWWLLQGNNAVSGSAVTCVAGDDANLGGGQICSNLPAGGEPSFVQFPWPIATLYTPQDMGVANVTTAGMVAGDYVYAQRPGFYITDLGHAADNPNNETYQIDSYGYGSSLNSAAVVESVYEVSQGMPCLTCSQ